MPARANWWRASKCRRRTMRRAALPRASSRRSGSCWPIRASSATDIAFIAHSTTQATNALLEGDLARVGVLGLLDRLAWLSRSQMRFRALTLDSGAVFAPEFAFARADDDSALRAAVDRLVGLGVQTLAASQSFGVDRPQRESAAVEYAHERGIEATSGHDVSSAYGLRARTRTAAINAAILPKMLRTARVTIEAVQRAAIPAPLMVMRSDGGVMDVREIGRRPILTLLSGPAAGIAGALLHEHLIDGVFVEVGGTSSDCSAIRLGTTADAAGAYRRSSHDAAHARRSHAGNRRRKHAARQRGGDYRGRAAQRAYRGLRLCIVRCSRRARRRAARADRTNAARSSRPRRARGTRWRANCLNSYRCRQRFRRRSGGRVRAR